MADEEGQAAPHGFLQTLKAGGKSKWVLIIAFGVVGVVVVMAVMRRASSPTVQGTTLPAGSTSSSGLGPSTLPGTFTQSDMQNLVGTVSSQYQNFLNQIAPVTAQLPGISSVINNQSGSMAILKQMDPNATGPGSWVTGKGWQQGEPVWTSEGNKAPAIAVLPWGSTVRVLQTDIPGWADAVMVQLDNGVIGYINKAQIAGYVLSGNQPFPTPNAQQAPPASTSGGNSSVPPSAVGGSPLLGGMRPAYGPVPFGVAMPMYKPLDDTGTMHS